MSYTAPAQVDSTIAGNPDYYASDAVEQCLEDIAAGAAAATGDYLEAQAMANAAIVAEGGSSQPGLGDDGGILLWASGMHAAIQGTPWETTDVAILNAQVWEALAFILGVEQAEVMWADFRALMADVHEDGLLIICP